MRPTQLLGVSFGEGACEKGWSHSLVSTGSRFFSISIWCRIKLHSFHNASPNHSNFKPRDSFCWRKVMSCQIPTLRRSSNIPKCLRIYTTKRPTATTTTTTTTIVTYPTRTWTLHLAPNHLLQHHLLSCLAFLGSTVDLRKFHLKHRIEPFKFI